VQVGTEFVIDFNKAIVHQVLRQESKEVVVVFNEDGEPDLRPIIMKVQSPIRCLAWEYEVLCKINDRIRPNVSKSFPSPKAFPTALSLVFLADGAILTTSMVKNQSLSRTLNLSDLKRMYDRSGEEIPEILIIYYTARMLYTIELLHWQAKVLVCREHLEP
jgi:hypothetical protein